MDQIVFTVNINKFASSVNHRNTGDTAALKLAHRLRQLATLRGHLQRLMMRNVILNPNIFEYFTNLEILESSNTRLG